METPFAWACTSESFDVFAFLTPSEEESLLWFQTFSLCYVYSVGLWAHEDFQLIIQRSDWLHIDGADIDLCSPAKPEALNAFLGAQDEVFLKFRST